MRQKNIHVLIVCLAGMVWLASGLLCKVLDLVPRHQLIVARILGTSHSVLLTKTIGAAEIVMAIWIWTGFRSRLNAIVQIATVIAMNCLELAIAPDLLLSGKLNFIFAMLFVFVIYYNEFVLTRKRSHLL